MTISQLAKAASGVSLRTIRYYEELGLIQPSGWSKGGQRNYGDDALVTLKKVRLLQESGMKLADIGKLLMNLAAKPTARKEQTLAHIESSEQIYKSLLARRDDIQTLISALEDVLKDKKKCTNCGATDCAKCGQRVKWTQLGLKRNIPNFPMT